MRIRSLGLDSRTEGGGCAKNRSPVGRDAPHPQADAQVNKRSEKEVVPPAIIAKLSSRSLRIAMATLLSLRGVPIEEIVENGEWEDVEMCKTYIRSQQPLAVQRRNLSNVIFPVRVSGEVAKGAAGAVLTVGAPTEGVAGLAGTLTEGVPTAGIAGTTVVQTLQDLLALAAARTRTGSEEHEAVPPAQLGGTLLLAGTEGTEPPKKRQLDSRNEPCHPLLWKKGKVFKYTNIRDDARLRALLLETASEAPAECQGRPCTAGYHTTRMEIGNYRKRTRGCAAGGRAATAAARCGRSSLLVLSMELMQSIRGSCS